MGWASKEYVFAPVDYLLYCNFQVTLKSGGIIQVGWASKDCVFAPEKGLGVGDDINSYSYDGGRCKIWNGKKTEHKVGKNF